MSLTRTGEMRLTRQTRVSGLCETSKVAFDFSQCSSSYALTVNMVTWEIYTPTREDLLTILWQGSAHWNFLQTRIDIGPLSEQTLGPFMASFLQTYGKKREKSELELLAAVKEEMEWKEFFQQFLLGESYLFRGGVGYATVPIVLPAATNYGVGFRFDVDKDMPFLIKEEVRFKVTLHTTWRTTIDIG